MKVMEAISDENMLQHLYYLLAFLAAWEKRPMCLTERAYEWCSAISEAAGKLEQREIPIIEPHPRWDEVVFRRPPLSLLGLSHHLRPSPPSRFALQFRLGQQGPVCDQDPDVSGMVGEEFSKVGPGCNPVRLCGTSHRTLGDSLEGLTPIHYAHLLSITLEIGFRLVPSRVTMAYSWEYTPGHDWILETAFSSHDDEVIADAMRAYIANRHRIPYGSFMRYFSKRVESGTPFSPRLQQVSIDTIELLWCYQPEALVLEAVGWLNRLNMDDLTKGQKPIWANLLVKVVCSPRGLENLSPRHWDFLDKLAPFTDPSVGFGPRGGGVIEPCGMEVMRLLEEAGDWEKLETWLLFAWRALVFDSVVEDVGRVTLGLLLRRPSALPRFENLSKTANLWRRFCEELRQICSDARAKQLPSEPSLPYVPIRLTRHLPALMQPFFAAVHRFTPSHLFSFLSQETTLSEFVYYVTIG